MRSAEAGPLKVHPVGSRLGACDALAIAPPNRRWLRLVLVGHDTNISNVAGALGVAWQLPAAPPNATPPGGALVWELWRRAGPPRGGWAKSASVARIIYIAQSLGQMRRAIPPTLASPPRQAPGNLRPAGAIPAPGGSFSRYCERGSRGCKPQSQVISSNAPRNFLPVRSAAAKRDWEGPTPAAALEGECGSDARPKM